MEPGPESIGMAMGVSEMSCLVRASLLSSIVIRLEPVTMPQAVFATIRPPVTVTLTGFSGSIAGPRTTVPFSANWLP